MRVKCGSKGVILVLLIAVEKGKRGHRSVPTEKGKKLPTESARTEEGRIGAVPSKNVATYSHEATGPQFPRHRRSNDRRVIQKVCVCAIASVRHRWRF